MSTTSFTEPEPGAVPEPSGTAQSPYFATDPETRQWAMLLHLSLLAGYIVPMAGFIVPVVIWQVKKAELPLLDAHGKMAVNWLLSAIIYALVSAILTVVLIGFLLLAVLAVAMIAFPIIAGVKAHSGELWKYPLAIRIFR